ncbi:HCP-like protein [Linnemannia elongata]|nr:HCP-like protein [Linnemannia elongata]
MPSGARTPGLPGQGSTLSSNGGGNGGVYRQNGPPGSGGGFSNSSTSLPLPPSRSNNNGPNNGPNNGVNLHPAHHLASGGYVRPEEPMGPSNPMPEKAEDYVRQGIDYHEVGDIAKATHFFRTAAEMGDPVGMLMYGLSVRHGWGCASNRQLAFQYLQKSAEHAVGDLKSRDSFASTAAKGELVLAIYELGICFRHGWGADKNKKTAAYYFEIAANLGDPDAQNDLAWCYYHGVGVKKDMFKAAKYYRLAAAQGLETVGNSWIWKDKYGGMPSSPTGDS